MSLKLQLPDTKQDVMASAMCEPAEPGRPDSTPQIVKRDTTVGR